MPGVHMWLSRWRFETTMQENGHSPDEMYRAWWQLANDAFMRQAFWYDSSEPWSTRRMAIYVEVNVSDGMVRHHMRHYRDAIRGAGHMMRHMEACRTDK